MNFVSWNVNGLRAVLKKNFSEVFEKLDADFFCIQETKLQEDIINIGITLNARATRERQFLRNTNLNRSATESKTANSIMKAELSLWNMQVFILSAATRQIRSQN